jgi:hypothetical protein
MKPAALLAAILLTSCQSAPTKARKIMAPIAKQASKATEIATRQRVSVVKLRGSVSRAAETAAAMNKAAPTPETKQLTLDLDAAQMEANSLLGTNDELRLTLANLETEVARAQDKVAEKIAGAEGKISFWKKASFWGWGAFFVTIAGVVSLFAFKTWLKTIPIIGPIINHILP